MGPVYDINGLPYNDVIADRYRRKYSWDLFGRRFVTNETGGKDFDEMYTTDGKLLKVDNCGRKIMQSGEWWRGDLRMVEGRVEAGGGVGCDSTRNTCLVYMWWQRFLYMVARDSLQFNGSRCQKQTPSSKQSGWKSSVVA